MKSKRYGVSDLLSQVVSRSHGRQYHGQVIKTTTQQKSISSKPSMATKSDTPEMSTDQDLEVSHMNTSPFQYLQFTSSHSSALLHGNRKNPGRQRLKNFMMMNTMSPTPLQTFTQREGRNWFNMVTIMKWSR